MDAISAKIDNSQNLRRTKIASIAGSALGIGASVGMIYSIAKKSNPNLKFSDLKYDELGIVGLGAGSIAGGLLGGLIADENKENTNPKIREGLQQLFGSLMCPMALVAVFTRALDKSGFKMPDFKALPKGLNNMIAALPRVGVIFGSLVLGMNVGNKIMNKVNNFIFKENKERKVELSDYFVHTDDACVAASLVLKDVESVSSVTNKIMPLAFLLSGIKTGTAQKETNP
ncbi:hypothetical protein IJ670_01435 [bacterium]|nr:hypothetical protein [bacterium]